MPRDQGDRRPDRRQRKSRAALRRALLDLVRTKPFDSITVEDLVAEADVARATFYAHYRDRADLLREICEELVGDAAERARATGPPERPGTYSGAAAAQIIRHAGEHADLYRLVLSGDGGPGPRRQLIDTLTQAVATVFHGVDGPARPMPIPMSMTAPAFTGALLAVVEAWLEGRLEGTPEELAAAFMHGQVEGLRWALGLDPTALTFATPESTE